ncbi:unnamed protein product [Prorocentrum cordatum]|uniref:Uncharacterized protein n=1 Tax=Prorocentrum cordatum TaxID=2364126 RepID=A0ABN9PZZ7_9DINO|nr:unnamed protein product [Polarella glacialis]
MLVVRRQPGHPTSHAAAHLCCRERSSLRLSVVWEKQPLLSFPWCPERRRPPLAGEASARQRQSASRVLGVRGRGGRRSRAEAGQERAPEGEEGAETCEEGGEAAGKGCEEAAKTAKEARQFVQDESAVPHRRLELLGAAGVKVVEEHSS